MERPFHVRIPAALDWKVGPAGGGLTLAVRASSFPKPQIQMFKLHSAQLSLVSLLSVLPAVPLLAETGYDAWLRYELIGDQQVRHQYAELPKMVVMAGDSPILRSAQGELLRGLRGMLGLELRSTASAPTENAIILGRLDNVGQLLAGALQPPDLVRDGFWMKTISEHGRRYLLVSGSTDRGVLYGTFALLRRIALHQSVEQLDLTESPYAPVRFLNQWDNLDGRIERGYAGKSIFWEKDHVVGDLSRARDYARLMASVGINGCSINNVNADDRVITPGLLEQVSRIANEFRSWGVRLLLSIDFSSPKHIGGLDTFDPLDARVIEFWNDKVEEVYRFVPDLAGFVLKADSEGRLGPSQYGRTHADAANVIARPLKAHGGLLFYRGFVYDHHMDWRDLRLDRAKAAYDNFHRLDGAFEDNVIVQLKHGPIDFQVREPASPLFGGLAHTSQAVELQITQEYTGQQRHVCFLVPMWKEVLDFDMQANGPGTPVKALVAGKTFKRPAGGFVAVSNVGRETNWLGHPLALANLYGFCRMAWNPDLSSSKIVEEWTRLTFGHDRRVVKTIVDLELKSWQAYEKYTGPLGASTLTDILGPHYGPAVESSERNGWGQWHRADEQGIGMDRSVASGTGFIGQYSAPVAAKFESLQSCPDELLLFMHHVPYTHVLHSGKTVIQHIYDSHYSGAEQAERFVEQWSGLKGLIDDERYDEVLKRLRYQAGHAIVWRDAVDNWFLRKSGIPDEKGRAGHFPNRIEAEAMELKGYSVIDISPWEAASGGKAVQVSSPDGHGSVSFRYAGKPGQFDIVVQYFDENDGVSEFGLFVAAKKIDHWLADDLLPSARPDGHTSTRRTRIGVALRTGDEIRIEATAQGGEQACIDYVEIAHRRD
jgi:alpha-glucuronidase